MAGWWIRALIPHLSVIHPISAAPDLGCAPFPKVCTMSDQHPPAIVPLEVWAVGDSWHARVRGELDMATIGAMLTSVTTSSFPVVVVDLTEISFMDCCGYGSLIAARHAVEASGRQLQITGWNGQPAHLRELIARLDGAVSTAELYASWRRISNHTALPSAPLSIRPN